MKATSTKRRPTAIKSFNDMKKVAISTPSETTFDDLALTTFPGAQWWFEAQLRRGRSDGPFMIEEILTATMARLLLDTNDANRRISEYQVTALATEMLAGTFNAMNGQTIQISLCGQLNDGQHRLHAKLKAGVDFKTRFMFGLPRDARLTIDQGRSRQSGDYLLMTGHTGGQPAATVAAILYQWRAFGTIARSSSRHIGRSQAADYAREHYEQIKASLQVTPRRGVGSIGGLPLLAFIHLLLAEKNFPLATDFIDRLVSGSELTDKSPILVCRQRLATDRRLRREERMELILRAWNAWRENRQVASLPLHKRIPELVA